MIEAPPIGGGDATTPPAGTDQRLEVGMMVAKIGVIIFSIEAAIMVVLSQWDMTAIPYFQDLLDAASLTLIASPIIYYGVARPFSSAAREANERLRAQLDEKKRLLQQNEALRMSLQKANEATAHAHDRILQKIGAELHDSPAQLLTYTMLQLRRLQPVAGLAKEAGITVDLDKVLRVTGDALREVRAISIGLALPELAGLTLAETIDLAVRRHEDLTGDKVGLEIRGHPEAFSLAHKICAYRFVQESLQNAHRHGGARTAHVTVEGGSLSSITVSDDGRGFDTSIPSATGLGIIGMRARVEAIGGQLAILSTPGRGTVICASCGNGAEMPG